MTEQWGSQQIDQLVKRLLASDPAARAGRSTALEVTVKGGNERLELISVTRP